MTYIVSHETYTQHRLLDRIYRLFNKIYRLFNIIIENTIYIYHNQYKYTKCSRHVQSYPLYIDIDIDNMDNMDTYRQYGQYRTECPDMSRYVRIISHIGQYMRPYTEMISYLNIQAIVHKLSTGYKYLNKCLREGPYPKDKKKLLILLSHINISNRNRK